MREHSLEENELIEMLVLVFSNDEKNHQNATKKFRIWISRNKPSIDFIVETGTVSRFVDFVKTGKNLELRINATYVLSYIAFGTSEQTKIVIEAGAVPVFIKALDSEFPRLKEEAVCALANIAGDCPEYRDLILNQGVMAPLLRILTEESLVKHSVWLLCNLCRGKYPTPDFEKVSSCLPTLSTILLHTDVEVLFQACWSITYLTNSGRVDHIQKVIDSGVCRRLVELLKHSSQLVILSTLSAVCNILTGNDDQTQLMLNLSPLPNLLHLLRHSGDVVKKRCCWTISNITAGTRKQIQEVVDAGIVLVLVQILCSDADFETKVQAAWALKNMSGFGTASQIDYLVSCGCIPVFCNFLTTKRSKIIILILDCLTHILRVGEEDAKSKGKTNPYTAMITKCFGYDHILALNSNLNFEVYRRAEYIIATYKFPSLSAGTSDDSVSQSASPSNDLV